MIVIAFALMLTGGFWARTPAAASSVNNSVSKKNLQGGSGIIPFPPDFPDFFIIL